MLNKTFLARFISSYTPTFSCLYTYFFQTLFFTSSPLSHWRFFKYVPNVHINYTVGSSLNCSLSWKILIAIKIFKQIFREQITVYFISLQTKTNSLSFRDIIHWSYDTLNNDLQLIQTSKQRFILWKETIS